MAEQFLNLPLHQLRPDPLQPRRELESEDSSVTEANTLQGLADSIREVGVLQPIRVREVAPGDFMIVSGQRRYEAARMLGLPEVPCLVVHNDTDSQRRLVSQVTENLQRKAMKASELAMAVQSLVQAGNSHDDVAKRLGIQNSQVTLLLNLLVLDGTAKSAFERGRVESPRAAYDLNRLPAAIQEQLVLQADEKDRVITQRDVREARLQHQAKLAQVRHRYEPPAMSRAETQALADCIRDGIEEHYDFAGDRDAVFGRDWREVEERLQMRQGLAAAGHKPPIDEAEILDTLAVRVPGFTLTIRQVEQLNHLLNWGWHLPLCDDHPSHLRDLGLHVAEMLTQTPASDAPPPADTGAQAQP